MGDFERVFTVGPVFRAENAMGPRHLCEFTGLDIEMTIKESYHEIMEVTGELFCYIFEGLEEKVCERNRSNQRTVSFRAFQNQEAYSEAHIPGRS